jgi:putative endonuclease
MTNSRKLGEIGEQIVVKHLVKHKFKIIDRNYRKKYGEIDIIARKNSILHFIEVKTVSSITAFEENNPEENVHFFKKERLKRVIGAYLAEKGVSHETDFEFQIDIFSVYFNCQTMLSKIRVLENVIL